MPERVRTFVYNLTDIFRRRASAARRQVSLPLSVSKCETRSRGRDGQGAQTCRGVTRDVSETGLSFVLSSVMVGGCHIFQDLPDTLLEVELPGGLVRARAVPVRYDSLSGGGPAAGYLIAVRIVEMDEADRELLRDYLRSAKVGAAKLSGLSADGVSAAAQRA